MTAMRLMLRPAVLAPALLTAMTLAACGAGTSAGPSAEAGGSATGGDLEVVAAFYPLQFVVDRVAGDRAEVTNLTPPGAEPHDLELSPQALAGLGDADLVVVLGGFQPALDDATGAAQASVLDLADVADRAYTGGPEHTDEDPYDDTDPHFWTDPTRMVEAAGLVTDALSEADPDGAEEYATNAEALIADLEELDGEAEAAFASCGTTTLVTAHDAFGYFADRYGFDVRPINGMAPDQAPDARTLAELSDFVAGNGITTVYTETLVSSAVADTVAAEAGVDTAVLDPLEGLTDASDGEDYLEVMRANIDAVRSGQACA